VPNDLLPANVPPNADEFPFNPFQLSVFDGNGNGFSGRFVALDDNKGGAARTYDADRLISPPFDLTNHTNIQLSFGSFNSNLIAGGQGDLFVEYSLDNGQSWTQIDRILGDGGGGPAQIIKTYTSLGVLAGKPSVRFAFKYNDKGVISGGAAIDNFRLAGQLVANPIARIETPTVSRNFVNKGTDAHVVYRFAVEAKDADVVLSDVILKTSNQEYKIEDFKPNSFRLFASLDSTLSANDRNLATLPVVGENKEIQMGCINYGIPRTQKHHFFFTVDVANDATVPDSISVSLPTISQNLFTILGIRDSSGIAPKRGGYQIIVNPNTPPTSEKIVFEMKMKTVVSDPNLAFKPEDFKFKDVDAPVLELNKLNKLRISTINIRTGAKFQLNGVDIATNQEIAVGDISKMVFTPRLNDAGLNYTTFTFKVFDGRDWSAIDYTAVINVINDKIFVPTLFSPNADGSNDYFMVRGGEGTIDKISLKIVDRNNNPMYDSSNLLEITTIGWDGKKDGKDQPAGAYMWYIEGTYKDGKPLEFNGKKTGIIRLVR
jgi:gliding motility-associated-like protein